MKKAIAILMCVGVAMLSGCAQPVADKPEPLTFQRGQQLLAAGSPKSAIPFLTETVVSQPDGPEPGALLALAYALDLQDERAIVQAKQVQRPAGSGPGWEHVAIGIAEMTQHRPAQAVAVLQFAASEAPQGTPLATGGRQWLTLALIEQGDPAKATESLRALAKCPHMFSTALMWMTLLYSQQGLSPASSEALIQCAKAGANDSAQRSLKSDLSRADNQTLYDAAVAALANGDFVISKSLFESVQANDPKGSDAGVWLSLIASAHQDWQTGRRLLKDACDSGSPDARGLAQQLYAVVCAIEDRPEDMVESLLAGQRLLGRNGTPAYIVEQPQPEPVWGSDYMK